MRKVYLLNGDCFTLCDMIIGEDRIQGRDWNTGTLITVFKMNIAYIEG